MAGYVAVFAVRGAVQGERRVVAYLAVLSVASALVAAAHRRARFSPPVQWALALCGLAHVAGGLLPGEPIFYETWLVEGVLKYDQAVHLGVSAVLTFAAWQLTRGRVAAAAVVAYACGLGNEVFELLSSLRFDDAYVGELPNTGWDLVFNLAGVLAASIWLAVVREDGAHALPHDHRAVPGQERRAPALHHAGGAH